MSSFSLRRNRGGGPQVEDLRESRDLRAAASPQGIYSYDEKRSDYVERPPWGKNGWEQLASALSKLNPHINAWAARKEQEFFDEQTATGKELMHRNKVSWAEFVKNNPEYAGLNPHLERGYRAAELSAKGQDFQAALQDFYTTGGLVNETDPTKVRDAINAFGKDWTAKNVKPDGYDAELYAENFLRPAEAAEGGILNRHVNDRAEEHLKLAVEKHGQLLASTIDAVLDNTPNISNPQVFSAAMDTIAAQAANQMAEMEASGVPRSQAAAVIEDAIINLAKAEGMEGQGDEILALAGRIKTGSGTIGGKPGFRAKEKAIREAWDNDRRQRNSEYMQMWHFNKAKAQEGAVTAIGNALMGAYKDRRPIPEATELMSLPGVGPEHIDIANAARNNFLGLTTYRPVMDKTAQLDFAVDRHLARIGSVSPQQAFEMVGRYGLDKAMDIYNTVVQSQSGTEPVSIALRSDGVKGALDTLEAQITATATATGASPSILKARIIEARENLLDKISVYVQEGEQKNTSRSPEQIRVFAREVSLNIGQEPLFREQDTPRNIQSPEEKISMGMAGYWEKNSIKYFSTKEAADEAARQFIRNEAQTSHELQVKYGIPPGMVHNFLSNQARIYSIDMPGLVKEFEEAKQMEKDRKAVMDVWENGYSSRH